MEILFFLFLIFVFPFWMHSLRKKLNAAADAAEKAANTTVAYQSVTLEDGTKMLVPINIYLAAKKEEEPVIAEQLVDPYYKPNWPN